MSGRKRRSKTRFLIWVNTPHPLLTLRDPMKPPRLWKSCLLEQVQLLNEKLPRCPTQRVYTAPKGHQRHPVDWVETFLKHNQMLTQRLQQFRDQGTSEPTLMGSLQGWMKQRKPCRLLPKGKLASIGKTEERLIFLVRGCDALTVPLGKATVGKELFHSLRATSTQGRPQLRVMQFPAEHQQPHRLWVVLNEPWW